MLRSILAGAVASQPDMRLVENMENATLEEALERTAPDVLIVNEQPERPEATFRQLLLGHASLKIVVLTGGGRDATVLELRRVHLADASPSTLIDAIRTLLSRGASPGEL
jgi:DNA-binding NarL/FixJ family response regulator